MTDEERFEIHFAQAKEHAISAIKDSKTPRQLFEICAILARGYGEALLSKEAISNVELKDRIRRW